MLMRRHVTKNNIRFMGLFSKNTDIELQLDFMNDYYTGRQS